MSASLVGSEMCIRDREAQETARSRCRWLQAACCAVGRLLLYAARRRSYPVSYTHLTLPTICSV
eukprot:1388050-Alexandrium_andersonii.AAC.1